MQAIGSGKGAAAFCLVEMFLVLFVATQPVTLLWHSLRTASLCETHVGLLCCVCLSFFVPAWWHRHTAHVRIGVFDIYNDSMLYGLRGACLGPQPGGSPQTHMLIILWLLIVTHGFLSGSLDEPEHGLSKTCLYEIHD